MKKILMIMLVLLFMGCNLDGGYVEYGKKYILIYSDDDTSIYLTKQYVNGVGFDIFVNQHHHTVDRETVIELLGYKNKLLSEAMEEAKD